RSGEVDRSDLRWVDARPARSPSGAPGRHRGAPAWSPRLADPESRGALNGELETASRVPPFASRPRIWVDTDIALGAPEGDVDDGFALAAIAVAHRKGLIELLGVSTVFGNTTAARSQGCAREMLRRAGVDVRLALGAEPSVEA